MKYKAYLVEEIDGVFEGSVQELELPALENGMVTIKVLTQRGPKFSVRKSGHFLEKS